MFTSIRIPEVCNGRDSGAGLCFVHAEFAKQEGNEDLVEQADCKPEIGNT